MGTNFWSQNYRSYGSVAEIQETQELLVINACNFGDYKRLCQAYLYKTLDTGFHVRKVIIIIYLYDNFYRKRGVGVEKMMIVLKGF